MKKIALFLLLSLVLGFTLPAQTAPIAHKSHSGTSVSIPEPEDGGFGNPPDELTKIIFLNDTTIIEVRERWGSSNAEVWDTVWNHPVFCKPGVDIDELKKQYPNLEFRGYKKTREGYNNKSLYNKNRKRNLKNDTGLIESPAALPISDKVLFSIAGMIALMSVGAYAYYRKGKNTGDA